MIHEIHTVTSFELVAPYTLRTTIDDNTVQVINVFPLLRGELYGPLRDLAFFNQVRLDSESGTLVWPNDADFDPATLHDWNQVGAAMLELAQSGPAPLPLTAPSASRP